MVLFERIRNIIDKDSSSSRYESDDIIVKIDDILPRVVKGKQLKQVHYFGKGGGASVLTRFDVGDLKVGDEIALSELHKYCISYDEVDSLVTEQSSVVEMPVTHGVENVGVQRLNAFSCGTKMVQVLLRRQLI